MRAACSLAASCASTTLFANRTRAPSRWASSPAFASNAARSRISFPNTPSCVLCFFCLVMVFSFLSLWLGYGPYAFMAPDQNLLGFPQSPPALLVPFQKFPCRRAFLLNEAYGGTRNTICQQEISDCMIWVPKGIQVTRGGARGLQGKIAPHEG